MLSTTCQACSVKRRVGVKVNPEIWIWEEGREEEKIGRLEEGQNRLGGGGGTEWRTVNKQEIRVPEA